MPWGPTFVDRHSPSANNPSSKVQQFAPRTNDPNQFECHSQGCLVACRDEPSCPWPSRLSMNTKRLATPPRHRYLQSGSPKPSALWSSGSQTQWSVRSRRCGREAEAMPKPTVSGPARTPRVGTCPDRRPASSTSGSGQPETFPASSRMSLAGGRPDVARRWSELLLLAISRLTALGNSNRNLVHCHAGCGSRPPHQKLTLRPGATHARPWADRYWSLNPQSAYYAQAYRFAATTSAGGQARQKAAIIIANFKHQRA